MSDHFIEFHAYMAQMMRVHKGVHFRVSFIDIADA